MIIVNYQWVDVLICLNHYNVIDIVTLEFNLSGASISKVEVDANDINIILSGASHVNLIGTVNAFYAEVSGASELSAFSLEADEAHVSASGASYAKVNVITTLHATASGASKITYRGQPDVTQHVSETSSVARD